MIARSVGPCRVLDDRLEAGAGHEWCGGLVGALQRAHVQRVEGLVGEPTTDQFRLFVDSTGSANAFALGELELFGTIRVVPEPATAALAMLGLGGMVMRRRRIAA